VMKSAIVLGKGELAIRVSEWFLNDSKHVLRCVVPVVPEPAWSASLGDWALDHGVPVVSSGRYQDVDSVMGDGVTFDLGISVFYDKIIKQRFIDRCGRIFNIHNGPLPRYRGVSPINWALRNGESEHGVTIHELETGIDTGAIVGQVRFSIYPEIDEVIDVYRRSLEHAWTLFRHTMPLLERIVPTPQDDGLATYYSRDMDKHLGDRRDFTRPQSLAADSHQSPGLDDRVRTREVTA